MAATAAQAVCLIITLTYTLSLVLQLVALLNAEQTSNVAIGSILMSTASTALTATTMFWDTDTDPGARKSSPEWYADGEREQYQSKPYLSPLALTQDRHRA